MEMKKRFRRAWVQCVYRSGCLRERIDSALAHEREDLQKEFWKGERR
jgi:hypothetical protein